MRNRFDNQLAELNNELISMGALCENAIASAVKSLIDGDTKLAAAAIRIDHEIDRKEREIESMCLKLLLQQQPVASDLRLISSVLKMITDMERIGDQASDIAEIVTLAWSVIEYDDVVDRLFDECKQDLIAEIAQSPADGERVLDVLMIAKYLERIGDHATNIAEWVEFSITGTHKSETHV